MGIFWQDGIANSAMFYFLNQGIIMRFLAAKSVSESRKAALSMMLILMTVGACVVGCGGWVARVLVHAGDLPADVPSSQAFYVATEFLSRPGIFGLILAALTAAVMSTVDTLITAVAAVIVNDVYKPYIQPAASERQLLRVARICSVVVTTLGVLLVPVFDQFRSIYEAHGAFTAAVTPPLVVTLLLSVFWRRFTRTAALCTLVGGLVAIGASMFVPELIKPFAHGVPMREVEDGFLSGMKQFAYMRACYGVVVCLVIGVVVSLFTRRDSTDKQQGLVWGTVDHALLRSDARARIFGGKRHATATIDRAAKESTSDEQSGLPAVCISRSLADAIQCGPGDRVYITDRRWWLGGLRSAHGVVQSVSETPDGENAIEVSPAVFNAVVTPRRHSQPVRVERH